MTRNDSKQLRGIFGAGMVPSREAPEQDTNPEPFGNQNTQETAKRCYNCGRDQADTFEAGKAWTIRALRKWLHTRMTGSEAIAVTSAFVRQLRRGP